MSSFGYAQDRFRATGGSEKSLETWPKVNVLGDSSLRYAPFRVTSENQLANHFL